ncbi:cadherin-like beta sandwich domain-containing protein, partial [Mucilaginibacter sp. OK098]|uniref:cadherin-like beta sandwich domain-containing protein n=1 Tax=Mucilaginibacter sp. OK098 TaxID=1855297 RepID=UPI0009130CAF
TLTAVSGPGYKNYTTAVPNSETSLQIIAVTQNAGATIKVNGITTASNVASQSIPLNVGANVITTVVTAQDGTTTDSYIITANRASGALSTNALLTSIKASPVSTLTAVSGPGYRNYTTAVPNSESSLQIIAVVQDATATIKVNGVTTASNVASQSIPLNVGANVITTVVTAQDGTTTDSYIITANRAAPGMALQYVENPADSLKAADDGIVVHKGLSPNGDGKNDVLTIDGLAKYPDNKLTIMNVGGVEIYHVSGYDNANKVFDGHSNKTMAMQKPGTYFYQLEYNDKGKVKYKTGYILLKY